ncbi:hypothetical protein KAH81_04035 [bacterium]|nr:hypothetical protein [bacterium]
MAKWTEWAFLKKASCPQTEFKEFSSRFRQTLIVLPKGYDDSMIKLAKEIDQILGGGIKSVVAWEKPDIIERVESLVIESKDINIFGWPKKSFASKFKDFTASIDLSPAFEIPISALPAMAGINTRLGYDESHAGNIYNVVINGRMEEVLKILMGNRNGK